VGAAVADGVVWVIDATGTATRVDSAQQSERLQVDLGGTLVDVVAADGSVYVGDIERGVVHELDAATGAARRQLTVPDGVVRLALDGPRLWVTGTDHTVTPIDRTTGVAGPPVEVGNGPIGLAVADGTVWVANGDDATVSRLDAATGARRGPDVAVGSGPVAIAVHGEDVWVLAQDVGRVTHLRASTGERAEPDIAVPAGLRRARDLVVTDAGVWIVGTDAGQVAAFPLR
jgi:streptogramin lyase